MATTSPLPCTMLRGIMAHGEQSAWRVALLGASGTDSERSFVAGVASGPISVGRQGDWTLDVRGLAAVEGFLYFDGNQLFGCSRDGGAPIMADGRPLGVSWEPLALGTVLVLGRARLIVEDPSPPPRSSSTVLTDLAALKAPPVPSPFASPPQKLGGLFSSDDEHTKIGEVLPVAPDLDDAPTAFLSASVRDAVREGLSSVRPPPSAPAASVPSSREARRSPRPPSELGVPESPFFSGVSSFELADDLPPAPGLPQGASGAALFPAPGGAQLSPRGAGPGATPTSTPTTAGALGSFWRDASPVRKATVLLLPVALAAFAFVMVGTERAHDAAPSPTATAAKRPTALPEIAPPPEPEAVTPRVLGGTSGDAKAPDGGVTLERRAVDAVHAHRLDEAAKAYDELQAADPKNAAWSAASAVLRSSSPPGPR